MISLTTVVFAVMAINIVDWWLLLRTTIKHDRELGQANQPNYGRSTYYLIFAQLLSIILITVIYTWVAGMFFPVSFPVSQRLLLVGIFAVVYLVFKLVVAIVQTLLNLIIIEVISARYERKSKKELKERKQ